MRKIRKVYYNLMTIALFAAAILLVCGEVSAVHSFKADSLRVPLICNGREAKPVSDIDLGALASKLNESDEIDISELPVKDLDSRELQALFFEGVAFTPKWAEFIQRYIAYPTKQQKERIDGEKVDYLIEAVERVNERNKENQKINKDNESIERSEMETLSRKCYFTEDLHLYLSLIKDAKDKNIEFTAYVPAGRAMWRSKGVLDKFPGKLAGLVRRPIEIRDCPVMEKESKVSSGTSTTDPIRILGADGRGLLEDSIQYGLLYKIAISSTHDYSPILSTSVWKKVAIAAGFRYAVRAVGDEYPDPVDVLGLDYKEFRDIKPGSWVYEKEDGSLVCYVGPEDYERVVRDTGGRISLGQSGGVPLGPDIEIEECEPGKEWKASPQKALAEAALRYVIDSRKALSQENPLAKIAEILKDTLFVIKTEKGSYKRHVFYNKYEILEDIDIEDLELPTKEAQVILEQHGKDLDYLYGLQQIAEKGGDILEALKDDHKEFFNVSVKNEMYILHEAIEFHPELFYILYILFTPSEPTKWARGFVDARPDLFEEFGGGYKDKITEFLARMIRALVLRKIDSSEKKIKEEEVAALKDYLTSSSDEHEATFGKLMLQKKALENIDNQHDIFYRYCGGLYEICTESYKWMAERIDLRPFYEKLGYGDEYLVETQAGVYNITGYPSMYNLVRILAYKAIGRARYYILTGDIRGAIFYFKDVLLDKKSSEMPYSVEKDFREIFPDKFKRCAISLIEEQLLWMKKVGIKGSGEIIKGLGIERFLKDITSPAITLSREARTGS
jgi:hypothetical protein